MKLHVPVTSAFPAVLATASALLLLVMLPAGGASVRSSGVAPALKVVAGDVVAAVENPVRVVTRANAKPKPVVSSAASATATAQVARPVPVHRHARHRARASRPRLVTSKPVTTPATPAPTPIAPITERANGKAKALGHVPKIAAQSTSTSTSGTLQRAQANNGHVKAHGRPADVPHGPPAVPPGQAKKGDAVEHGASGDPGGGK